MDDFYREPPRSRPIRYSLSQLRLFRTVGGITYVYRLVDSITVVQGGGPKTIPVQVEPNRWSFPNVHGSVTLGEPGVSVIK